MNILIRVLEYSNKYLCAAAKRVMLEVLPKAKRQSALRREASTKTRTLVEVRRNKATTLTQDEHAEITRKIRLSARKDERGFYDRVATELENSFFLVKPVSGTASFC